jgi:hypothetical protein
MTTASTVTFEAPARGGSKLNDVGLGGELQRRVVFGRSIVDLGTAQEAQFECLVYGRVEVDVDRPVDGFL